MRFSPLAVFLCTLFVAACTSAPDIDEHEQKMEEFPLPEFGLEDIENFALEIELEQRDLNYEQQIILDTTCFTAEEMVLTDVNTCLRCCDAFSGEMNDECTDRCWFQEALLSRSGNKSECASIKLDAYYAGCLAHTGLVASDPQYCDDAKTAMGVLHCYRTIGTADQHGEICTKIRDEKKRKHCAFGANARAIGDQYLESLTNPEALEDLETMGQEFERMMRELQEHPTQ